MLEEYVINNVWILFSGLLVFLMTIPVALLEVGELGHDFSQDQDYHDIITMSVDWERLLSIFSTTIKSQ